NLIVLIIKLLILIEDNTSSYNLT
ncbi:hypothetical protein FPSE_10798, partial [Fusarium pseudograminearum CS3096]